MVEFFNNAECRLEGEDGDVLYIEAYGGELVFSIHEDAVPELDAPRVDALIALLQRWRATGQLRPEGEGE